MPRHIEQPAFGRQSKPASMKIRSRPSRSACAFTCIEPGMAETEFSLVRLRDLGATFVEVDVEMKARTGGTHSATRVKGMWRTLTGLLSFWRQWREERRAARS